MAFYAATCWRRQALAPEADSPLFWHRRALRLYHCQPLMRLCTMRAGLKPEDQVAGPRSSLGTVSSCIG